MIMEAGTCAGQAEITALGGLLSIHSTVRTVVMCKVILIHTSHTSTAPQDICLGKTSDGVLASLVFAEGWDQPLLFVFSVSASEVCPSAFAPLSL